MTELDTSTHLLNNSSSKQKFSFSKTERFRNGQKILYALVNIVAIAFMIFLEQELIELPHLVMVKKISVYETINLYLQLALMNLEASSRKISIEDLDLVVEEMYLS